jgi:hypothetical protein
MKEVKGYKKNWSSGHRRCNGFRSHEGKEERK